MAAVLRLDKKTMGLFRVNTLTGSTIKIDTKSVTKSVEGLDNKSTSQIINVENSQPTRYVESE